MVDIIVKSQRTPFAAILFSFGPIINWLRATRWIILIRSSSNPLVLHLQTMYAWFYKTDSGSKFYINRCPRIYFILTMLFRWHTLIIQITDMNYWNLIAWFISWSTTCTGFRFIAVIIIQTMCVIGISWWDICIMKSPNRYSDGA